MTVIISTLVLWVVDLKKEAILSSETSATFYNTARGHNPENQNRH
jgi:hypothetical protein